jgi:eukaryotic-like serine/threonine-protein kinase
VSDGTGDETRPDIGAGGARPGSGQRYERIDRIATGGMGEVWRARDTVLGREVAVKVLKQEYADDPTFRARFADEARHAAGLHHPGIASIFDYGAQEGEAPYLVMELVDGRPLSELLAGERAIDPEQARLLALQVAEALAVAHRAGVVHRDVKPANLLVTPDGRVKITDFGIARAAGSVAYTQTGQIVGTPHYISPEQARGDTATAASDVYALGVVLFECLNGTRPFVADSPIATALAHIRDEVPPLPDTVPPALAAVVARALQKDPAQRYADGGELAAALREAADPHAVVAPPPDSTQVMAPPVPAPVAPVAPVATPVTEAAAARVTTTKTQNRWPLYAAAVLVLVVVAALLVAHPWTDDSPTDTDNTPAAGDTVRVRAAAYIGDPVEDVEAALADKGLKTRTDEVDNSGDHDAGTVADLDPTGKVKVGSTITLDVWGDPPSDESGNSGGSGDSGSSGDTKTKPPKPEKTDKTKAPPPEDPGQTDQPGGGSGGGGGGNQTGSPAPDGRGTKAAEPGKAAKPTTGTKGD